MTKIQSEPLRSFKNAFSPVISFEENEWQLYYVWFPQCPGATPIKIFLSFLKKLAVRLCKVMLQFLKAFKKQNNLGVSEAPEHMQPSLIQV